MCCTALTTLCSHMGSPVLAAWLKGKIIFLTRTDSPTPELCRVDLQSISTGPWTKMLPPPAAESITDREKHLLLTSSWLTTKHTLPAPSSARCTQIFLLSLSQMSASVCLTCPKMKWPLPVVTMPPQLSQSAHMTAPSENIFPVLLKQSSLSLNQQTEKFQSLDGGACKRSWSERGPALMPLGGDSVHTGSVQAEVACCHQSILNTQAHYPLLEGSAWHKTWHEATLTDGHRWWQWRDNALYIQQLQGPQAMALEGSGVCKTCMVTVKKACATCGLD